MGLYRIFLLFSLLFFVPAAEIFAQQTQSVVADDAAYRNGLDLFSKQKFAEAQNVFDDVVRNSTDKNSLLATDAEYYAAICAMELFHKDAEVRLKNFLSNHPESSRCRMVHFQLGRYNYRKKDYDEALSWFRLVEIYDLQKDELSEFYFKRGYSHYALGHTDSAKSDFFEIRDINSKYSPAANYYYSHIAYLEGNYETALAGFLKLQNDPTFGPVTPWYISQIYYLQGKYNEVIAFAPPLLDSADTKKVHEIAHIIGASYYRTNRYKEAIPFLEKHRAADAQLTREESYELGYSYYKTDSASKAIPFLEAAAADSADVLAQNAWYHLADCYVRTGDKLSARNSFGKASSMKHDLIIREDALFNYARLCYELSFSPFNEAIVACNNYIAEFPNSPRKDEAYTLLTNAYLSSTNYAQALASIESIKTPSVAMQATHQKVAYNRAIELFNQKNYPEAIKHFDKSLTYPLSRELNSNAHYWKGECYYAMAETGTDTAGYTKAVVAYKQFQITPGATVLPNYNTANYNIGYCYFEKKNYAESVIWFRKYITNKGPNDSNDRIFDAYLCMGDGYFRNADFINASEFYGKAVATPTASAVNKDYAMYQQAMALGYLGKKDEKASVLRKMRETYPASTYLANGQYQEARTLHELKKYDEALRAYNDVYLNDPKGPFAVSSLTNMGQIYRIKSDYDNALSMYKKAVELIKGKGTQEFNDLMREIKDMYLAKNQLDQWETYAASVGFSESTAVADSTSYAFAAKFYNLGNCTEALAQANKYILKYPSGMYITEVHYMRAECSFKANDFASALGSYNAILDKGQTKYTEVALKRCGFIYYSQKDWPNATRMYQRLETEARSVPDQNDAKVNLMRCYLFQSMMDSAYTYAGKVLTIKGLPNDILGQANYLKGKSEMEAGNYTAAEKNFALVPSQAPNTAYAAEASFRLCEIKYRTKPSKAVETSILKHINDYDAFSEWAAEGWLLLANNHLALKDTSKARVVLNWYIENGDSPAHVKKAQEKISWLDALQNRTPQKREDDMIIPLGNPDDNKLFEEGNGGGQ